MNDVVSPRNYVELKGMLRALGDVARLHMVETLARANEMSVTDLAQRLVSTGHPITQPLVSWHLAILRRHGLVRTRRHGRLVYCSLDRARYEQCLRMLGELAGTTAGPGQPVVTAPAAPLTGPAGAPPDALGALGGHPRG